MLKKYILLRKYMHIHVRILNLTEARLRSYIQKLILGLYILQPRLLGTQLEFFYNLEKTQEFLVNKYFLT